MAPPVGRDNPFTRSIAGMIGAAVLSVLVLACLVSLPYTLASAGEDEGGRSLPARYKQGDLDGFLLPPTWAGMNDREAERFEAVATNRAILELGLQTDPEAQPAPTQEQIAQTRPFYVFGADKLGRGLFTRCLTGGGVSIGIGLAAAAISVLIGTLYGMIAGYFGGRLDAVMMRIVDILYGLPYLLLVVLLAVAGDAMIDSYATRLALNAQAERKAWMLSVAHDPAIAIDSQTLEAVAHEPLAERIAQYLSLEDASINDARRVTRANQAAIRAKSRLDFAPIDQLIDAYLDEDADARSALEARASANPDLPRGELSAGKRTFLEVFILLAAIGGLAWLTMARVIRGQVLSLKAQPFMEAARAMGVPPVHQFLRHLLPNLLGPIIVYATLTVPQAILQESFLSFLGIGVRPPLPSWGNLAADGLIELNTVKIRWWLLLFPSLLLGVTLLALNFVGEGLREALDPKRAKR